MYFYVTGFGKFGNILENPTTVLVRNLSELLNADERSQSHFKVELTDIVTVSIQDCDNALERIYEKVAQCQDRAEHHVVINFGVAASRRVFSLESIGKNIADFRIPDESGAQPRNQCINQALDISHTITCDLDLNILNQSLVSKGYPCEVSNSAGEYICNYAYYCNLQRREQFCRDRCVTNLKSLFVHVPAFSTIQEQA